MKRPPALALLILFPLAVLPSCSSPPPERPAAPAPPPRIDVAMEEFRYVSTRTDVPAGRVVFGLANAGQQFHQPLLAILPDDLPPILEQLRGTTRRSIGSLVNNPGLPPGVRSAIAVDLEPGQRYAFICVAKSPEAEQDHSRMGMVWEFRAGGEAEPDTQPAP
ncbi:MAG: hypothetical protein ACT4OS_11665 [Acidimicrobiales bacterium]